MKKLNWVNRIVSLALIVVVGLSSIGIENHIVWANEADIVTGKQEEISSEENVQEIQNLSTGYVDIGHVAPRLEENGEIPLTKATVIPEQYSSVEKGYVTSVKNQSQWGVCWAFAACAAMESYVLSHGMVDNADEVDFCEYALAYLTFQDTSTQEETGDYTLATDLEACFEAGGNDEYAFKSLSKWAGIYNESLYIDSEDEKCTYYEYSVENSEIVDYIADEENIDFVFTGQYYINIEDTERIKYAVMENGAVTASYYADTSGAYSNQNFLYNYNYEVSKLNHAITIVGWDDELSKENFAIVKDGTTYMPEKDGAWLVKNSWGTYYGDGGYIWISYEDLGILQSDAVVYEVAPKLLFDNIYQHDGAMIFASGGFTGRNFASVHEVTGAEKQKIQAVSFAIPYDTNCNYTINIYKTSDVSNLGQEILVASKAGQTFFAGYYTVLLDDPVEVENGECYTIEICFDDRVAILAGVKESLLQGGEATRYSTGKSGESYYCDWQSEYIDIADLNQSADLCIKMFTTDEVDEIEIPQITDISLSDKDRAKITWQPSNDATYYELWVANSTMEEFTLISEISDNSYEYDVVLGQSYYFKVRTVNESGETSDYSVIKKFDADIPAVDISGYCNLNTVMLTWNDLSYVDGYKIYRSIDGGEYSLLKDISSDEECTFYEDTDVVYTYTYNYYIVAYIYTTEGITINSKFSNVESFLVEVPVVFKAFLFDDFYKKFELRWEPFGDIVDGYIIEIGMGERTASSTAISTIDIDDGNIGLYVFDTTEYEIGTKFWFTIYSYAFVEGEKKVSFGMTTHVTVEDKEKPLEAEVKWWVDNSSRLMIKIEEPTQQYVNMLHYPYWAVPNHSISLLETGITYYTTDPYDTTIDIYIISEDKSTAWQDEPYKIGGKLEVPKLEVIDDVVLDSSEDTVLLEAKIENKMENFEYLYQWYVSDSESGTGRPISGATESTYEATVGLSEEKYFYCKITTRYIDTYTSTTTNSEGGMTCVTGALKAGNLTVDEIEEQKYTGVEIKPKITVRNEEVVLTEGIDYVVSYSENINVGKASVTITFQGNYAGTITRTFTIVAKSLEDTQILNVVSQTYIGSAITPSVTVKDGNTTLVKDTDYTVSYSNNVNVGAATVTITGKGNYTGTKEVTFTITAKSLSNTTVSAIANQTYTGSAITPSVTVTDGSKTLVKDTDYTVSYSNNVNVGGATVTITGKGNYTGTKTVTFTITAKSITNVSVSAIANQTYTGSAISPSVTVKDGNTKLVKDRDYTVSYSNNVNAGRATVTITGKGNYTGTKEVTFTITAKSLSNTTVSAIANQTYTGSAITPSVTVKDGNTTLVKDKDYTVSYSNNVNVGTATVTITGKGNYTGTKTVNFTIKKKEEPKPSVPSKITSSIVNVNESLGCISKITIGTTVQKFRSSLNETAYVKVYKGNQAVSDSTVLATGMQACLMNGNTITKKYNIIVTGDVNGDGKINITDMIAIKANILKKSTLSGAFEKAGDVNGDGKINVTDFIKIKATLLKKDTIVGVAVK